MKVETGLESALETLTAKIDEVLQATRATNMLLLANAMREDATEPVAGDKVLRHLASVERSVRSDKNV